MTPPQGLLCGVLLLMALMVYTFWPVKVFANQREKTRLEYLQERREQLDESLRELDFDFRTGKFAEAEFQAQRAQLGNEAAQIEAEIEQLRQALRLAGNDER
jgi:chromosome segregation ATPase